VDWIEVHRIVFDCGMQYVVSIIVCSGCDSMRPLSILKNNQEHSS
jgi:hypothetical protein